MTLNCEGMSATPALEEDLSSRAKESSKRRLSYGRDRGAASSVFYVLLNMTGKVTTVVFCVKIVVLFTKEKIEEVRVVSSNFVVPFSSLLEECQRSFSKTRSL